LSSLDSSTKALTSDFAKLSANEQVAVLLLHELLKTLSSSSLDTSTKLSLQTLIVDKLLPVLFSTFGTLGFV
jgi:hypothetical protein